MSMTMADDRAQRGAAWLDKNGPADWWNLIDIDRFHIASPSRCVLGQLYKDQAGEETGWDWAYDNLFGAKRARAVTDLGFDAVGTESVSADKLTAAWRNIIIQRRCTPAARLNEMGWMPSRDGKSMISPGTGSVIDIEALNDIASH